MSIEGGPDGRTLAGKVIIVTGGGSGIGRAASLLFAADGAAVVVVDRDAARAREVCEEAMADGARVAWVEADVSKEADAARPVEVAVSRFGRLDGAFNNAGVSMRGLPLAELDIDSWHRCLGVDLTGVFLCMRAQIPAMTRSGGGAIVNNASCLGILGQPAMSEYAAAKHGVVGLTKAASTEFPWTQVRVNAVLPGTILTPMVEAHIQGGGPEAEAYVAATKARHSVGRFGTGDDVAKAARWLLSNDSTFINGVSLPVDGGFSAR